MLLGPTGRQLLEVVSSRLQCIELVRRWVEMDPARRLTLIYDLKVGALVHINWPHAITLFTVRAHLGHVVAAPVAVNRVLKLLLFTAIIFDD